MSSSNVKPHSPAGSAVAIMGARCACGHARADHRSRIADEWRNFLSARCVPTIMLTAPRIYRMPSAPRRDDVTLLSGPLSLAGVTISAMLRAPLADICCSAPVQLHSSQSGPWAGGL